MNYDGNDQARMIMRTNVYVPTDSPNVAQDLATATRIRIPRAVWIFMGFVACAGLGLWLAYLAFPHVKI